MPLSGAQFFSIFRHLFPFIVDVCGSTYTDTRAALTHGHLTCIYMYMYIRVCMHVFVYMEERRLVYPSVHASWCTRFFLSLSFFLSSLTSPEVQRVWGKNG